MGMTPFLLYVMARVPKTGQSDPYIKNKLAVFTKGKSANESVFGLAPKTISMKIGQWARKALCL